MTGVRTRSARLVLLMACILGAAVAGCGDAAASPSPSVAAHASQPASEPSSRSGALAGPLPTIDPAVIASPELTCGIDDSRFPPAALDGPGEELAPDAAAAALREFLLTEPAPAYPFPRAGWHRVAQTADRELFVAPTPSDPPWLAVAFTRSAGAWVVDAYGACALSVALPGGIGLADWWVDPAAPPPTPQSTTIAVQLMERACAGGGPPNGRVLAPVVEYRPDAIVVTIAVASIPGVSDCESNPSVPLTIQLTEPLRDRALLDGGTVPPHVPVQPS